MLIDYLQRHFLKAPVLAPLMDKLDDSQDASLGVIASARPFIVASLYARKPRPMLVVLSGADAAERFARGVSAFLGHDKVMLLPERDDLPWQQGAPDPDVIGARTQAIGTLALGRPVVVVSSARALLRKVAPPGGHIFAPLIVTRENGVIDGADGEVLSYEDLAAHLVERGYEHFDEVDGPGTFCIHGDSIDIFGAGMTAPVRIEFFGDEVDGLRRVVPSTGQSIGEVACAQIWPMREFSVSKKGLERLHEQLAAVISTDRTVADQVRMLEAGIGFAGIDRYLPDLYQRTETPIAHICADTLVILAEPRSLFDDATRRYDELSAIAIEAGIDQEHVEAYFCSPAKLDFGTQQRLTLLSIMRIGGMVDVDLQVKHPGIAGREERLFSLVRSLNASGVMTVFSVADRNAREDMELLFNDASISFVEALDSSPDKLRKDLLNITDIDVPSGFIIPEAHIAFISISDLSQRAARHRSDRRVDITEVTFPYKPGDYVVHASHGIALFKDIVCRSIDGVERDYLLLAYAQEDKLYVPIEQIDRVTRYVGPDGSAPRLTRLDTADWTRAIGKARKSAKKLAFDLVDLYSRRSTVKGFSYALDDVWQEEMEHSFPYQETPDQLAAIADVKADMESERPMDRLICGDVGFGKTEVALRAAFKAASDHRQVMVLCPTTILAQQHYTTFSDRFAPFGIDVEVLSRFRTPSQQKKALEGFAAGTVDVLVGTHRLLSRDVNPKNLGLVVIDEEQRFGVQHKEQLKTLREQIDVLTLSATPIPRTLQMSLSGVRDMSLIMTPPPNRRPVKVHVGEWDEDIVSGAIRREMARGGQVYYISNRVHTIDDAVRRVSEAAPEARIGVAHGQMGEKQLEEVMELFSANEIDVLVATTIVESGLDNPHTNTLIIEDSQRLGLAQLYQLKGRVGRSTMQAYALFLFPPDRSLTQEATERLEAIGEFTDLGGGMKIAMRDLEIRGAGTMLGAEQSGNMSAVGFDLFASMLAQAVSDARGEQKVAHPEIVVDVAEAFHIPEEYMPAADERVLYYRRLAAAETVDDVDRIAERLRSAYGGLPQPVVNLCDRARIKALASNCGVESVFQSGGKLVIQPILPQLAEYVSGDTEAHRQLVAVNALYIPKGRKYSMPVAKGEPALETAVAVLDVVARVAEENS